MYPFSPRMAIPRSDENIRRSQSKVKSAITMQRNCNNARIEDPIEIIPLTLSHFLSMMMVSDRVTYIRLPFFSVAVCQSIDIRNSVRYFSRLSGCRLVEGFVQILLIDNAEPAEYANISFPELREITGYLLFYRVKGLRSIGRLFPNLSVIRGHSLFINYALVVFEMMSLQEVGLHSLTTVVRGSVRFEKNPALCYVDTIDWDLIAKSGKGEHIIVVRPGSPRGKMRTGVKSQLLDGEASREARANRESSFHVGTTRIGRGSSMIE
ncbi:hypothetical protein K0M31_017319 [Melipona bicolor]|uniref:Receptor L-domain domain-containing protein n=1 Tax=Melipona bicolor TaxID=60889 RepID=A0AA40G4V0_9HYME|nr:hypothetical protein K0M31_017319 [Melipona bicolor]